MDCLPHIHVAAIHAEAGYETYTPGIGVFCRETNTILGAGVYLNSEKTKPRLESKYAFVGYQPFRVDDWKVGAIIGVVDNYSKYNYGWGPLAGIAASKPTSFGETHLMFVPKTKYSPTLVQISFTIRY